MKCLSNNKLNVAETHKKHASLTHKSAPFKCWNATLLCRSQFEALATKAEAKVQPSKRSTCVTPKSESEEVEAALRMGRSVVPNPDANDGFRRHWPATVQAPLTLGGQTKRKIPGLAHSRQKRRAKCRANGHVGVTTGSLREKSNSWNRPSTQIVENVFRLSIFGRVRRPDWPLASPLAALENKTFYPHVELWTNDSRRNLMMHGAVPQQVHRSVVQNDGPRLVKSAEPVQYWGRSMIDQFEPHHQPGISSKGQATVKKKIVWAKVRGWGAGVGSLLQGPPGQRGRCCWLGERHWPLGPANQTEQRLTGTS